MTDADSGEIRTAETGTFVTAKLTESFAPSTFTTMRAVPSDCRCGTARFGILSLFLRGVLSSQAARVVRGGMFMQDGERVKVLARAEERLADMRRYL